MLIAAMCCYNRVKYLVGPDNIPDTISNTTNSLLNLKTYLAPSVELSIPLLNSLPSNKKNSFLALLLKSSSLADFASFAGFKQNSNGSEYSSSVR